MRSMTDEQMLTKYGYDKAPWIYPNGERTDTPVMRHGAKLDPRPECIPSRDPAPFRIDGVRADRSALDRVWTGGEGATFDPRPEFTRPPVNLILSAFREDPDLDTWLWSFTSYDAFGGHIEWDRPDSRFHVFATAAPEQIDFARKVLTRLAALA